MSSSSNNDTNTTNNTTLQHHEIMIDDTCSNNNEHVLDEEHTKQKQEPSSSTAKFLKHSRKQKEHHVPNDDEHIRMDDKLIMINNNNSNNNNNNNGNDNEEDFNDGGTDIEEGTILVNYDDYDGISFGRSLSVNNGDDGRKQTQQRKHDDDNDEEENNHQEKPIASSSSTSMSSSSFLSSSFSTSSSSSSSSTSTSSSCRDDSNVDVDIDDNDETSTTTNNNKDSMTIKYEYPKPFYCNHSHILLVDPVVHPNGLSYEKSIIKEHEPNLTYYPNRALKSIIQDEVQQRSEQNTMIGTIKRIDTTIRSNVQQFLLEQTQNNNSNQSLTTTTTASTTTVPAAILPSKETIDSIYRPLSDGYYCPITQEIMLEPVLDPDGNTFERSALFEWLRTNRTSPITRNPYLPSSLSNVDIESYDIERSTLLYQNKALTELLQLEMNKSNDSIHPTISSWKEEVGTIPTQTMSSGTTTVTGPYASTIPIPIEVITTPTTTEQLSSSRSNTSASRQLDGRVCCCIIIVLIFISGKIRPSIFYIILMTIIFFTCIKACRDERSS